MAFIEIKPKRASISPNKVRVCFIKSGNSSVAIVIGIPPEIFRSIGVNLGDSVSISYDDSNPRILLIKKNNAGYFKTFKPTNKLNIIRIKVNNRFGIPPTEDDLKTREVEHDLYEGCLRIYA